MVLKEDPSDQIVVTNRGSKAAARTFRKNILEQGQKRKRTEHPYQFCLEKQVNLTLYRTEVIHPLDSFSFLSTSPILAQLH